jgi:hypothetical protein
LEDAVKDESKDGICSRVIGINVDLDIPGGDICIDLN